MAVDEKFQTIALDSEEILDIIKKHLYGYFRSAGLQKSVYNAIDDFASEVYILLYKDSDSGFVSSSEIYFAVAHVMYNASTKRFGAKSDGGKYIRNYSYLFHANASDNNTDIDELHNNNIDKIYESSDISDNYLFLMDDILPFLNDDEIILLRKWLNNEKVSKRKINELKDKIKELLLWVK